MRSLCYVNNKINCYYSVVFFFQINLILKEYFNLRFSYIIFRYNNIGASFPFNKQFNCYINFVIFILKN